MKQNSYEQNLHRLLDKNEQNADSFKNTLNHRVYIDKSLPHQHLYKIELLVPHFQPGDIQVKLNENKLNVQAKRQVLKAKQELLKESEFFERTIELPHFVLLNTAHSYLEQYKNDQNILVIEAVVNEKFKDQENLIEFNSKHNKRKASNEKPKKSPLHQSKFNTEQLIMNHQKQPQPQQQQQQQHSDECLKYRFDLQNVESKNISITIREKSILEIRAFKDVLDVNGNKSTKEFNHEINLPDDVEIFNIKNCFDEEEGILRIEIPTATRKIPTKENNKTECGHDENSFSKLFSKDKYLELLFDLYDFKFENLQVYHDEVEKKKILLVRAYKFDKQLNRNRTNTRRFILPDWISDQNINILEDEANINNEVKNLLKLQFEIAE